VWTQIVSNTIGEPQELPEQNIGASYGDALLAGIAADLVEADADWSRIVETVEPDPSQQEVYDELYTIYRDLYPATRDQAHTLTDIQTRQSEA
jgi:xylulokinase